MRIGALLLFLLVFLSPSTHLCAQDAGGGKLLKVVALSRHGVRAPTQSHKTLRSWSQKPWPIWPVAKGDLTGRGAELVTAMWQNFRSLLAEKGLLPEKACPSPNSIYIRADVDERTRATAFAMTRGLGANCSLGYYVMEDLKIDPLFHPVKAGLYHYNPASVAANIMAETNGGLNAVQERYLQPLELLENVIGSPSPEICARFSFTDNCSLSDLPNAISVSSEGNDVKLVGALSIASDIAEIFLLEYGEWPGSAAGWGMVNNKVLSQILPIHSAVFDIVNRTPRIAMAQGGFLLNEMALALEGKHPDAKVNDAKLVVFVGHDTNIANIGGLLGLNWKMEEYPENGIPPASVLFLELWERDNTKEVTINFYTQTMQALHTAVEASGSNLNIFSPAEASVTSPPIAGKVVIELDKFVSRADKACKGAPMTRQPAPRLFYAPPSPRKKDNRHK